MRMFRCVRRTWMLPSAALLKESKTVGARRTFIAGTPSWEQLLLARLHLVPVVVAEQVQQPVRERPAPLGADDLRAEDDIAERARYSFRDLVAAVDREREHIGRLVDPKMVALQLAHLVL